MARCILGDQDGPPEIYKPDVDRAKAIQDRAELLREELEGFVVQMAVESAEMGCAESTDALRMQAIGILLSLRELQRHIPEIAD